MSTRIDFADELESASDRIEEISHADLQIILRRAALRLRNVEGLDLEPDIDEAIGALANGAGVTRKDLIRSILRDWLETGTYLPVRVEDD